MDFEVGICILNYFSEKEITSRLLLEFERDRLKLPICIVDNSNNQIEFMNLCKKTNERNLNIKIINNKKNTGYFKGNLVGVKCLYHNFNCDKILIINPDVSSKNWNEVINKLNKGLKNSNDFIIGPKIFNGSLFVSSPILKYSIYTDILYNFSYPLSYLIYKFIQIKISKKSKKVFAVEGSVFLVDSKKFLSIKKYFKDIFLYKEEIIFGIVAKKLNWNIYYDNTVVVNHYHKPMQMNFEVDKFNLESTKIITKLFYNKKLIKIVVMSYKYRFWIKKRIFHLLHNLHAH